MPYFDPSLEADRDLLHESVRDHDYLKPVADKAEYDVFEWFTEAVGYLTFEVRLWGYDADPNSANASLKEDARRTIAEVVSHRLRFYDVAEGVFKEKLEGYEYEAEGSVDRKWPDGWNRRLIKYDKRHPLS